MSSAWFVETSEEKREVYYDFDEALFEFLKAIFEGAEDATLKWSS